MQLLQSITNIACPVAKEVNWNLEMHDRNTLLKQGDFQRISDEY